MLKISTEACLNKKKKKKKKKRKENMEEIDIEIWQKMTRTS